MINEKIIIDANNATLGRLASYAAKQALLGKQVTIVNCNEVVVSGKSKSIISEYGVKRKRASSGPHGPYFPKSPEKIVKRTIRGMLSYKQRRGKESLKRIKCYNDIPEDFRESKKKSWQEEENPIKQ